MKLTSPPSLESVILRFKISSWVFLALALVMLLLAVAVLVLVGLKVICSLSNSIDAIITSSFCDIKEVKLGEMLASLATLGFLASTIYIYYSGRYYNLLDRYPSVDIVVASKTTDFLLVTLTNEGNVRVRDLEIEVRSDSKSFNEALTTLIQSGPTTLRQGQIHKFDEARLPHCEEFKIELTYSVAIDRLRQFSQLKNYKIDQSGQLKEVHE